MQRGESPYNECPVYDIKKSDGETAVIQELFRNEEYLFPTIVPMLLWPGLVAFDSFLLMSRIELFDF